MAKFLNICIHCFRYVDECECNDPKHWNMPKPICELLQEQDRNICKLRGSAVPSTDLLDFYVRPWLGGGWVVLCPSEIEGGDYIQGCWWWFKEREQAVKSLLAEVEKSN
jgi:hypothetical protein